jgi:hypothetical protein
MLGGFTSALLHEQQDLNPLEVTTSDDLSFKTTCVTLGSLMDLIAHSIL